MTTEPLAVLYEDAHVLAVSKPAGLLTQGTVGGEPTLEDVVRRHLAPGPVYLGTVHRLDRPVSGVVLWAKTPKAARRLAEEFAAREAVKEYWAAVESPGGPFPFGSGAGVWDDWLTASADAGGVVRAVAAGSPGAKRAVTRYRFERAARLPEGVAWVRLWPETGRTHQLRAQATLRGLPVWGDTPYGASRSFPQGIALHARAVTVRHPILRRPLTLTAPLPAVWAAEGIDPGP